MNVLIDIAHPAHVHLLRNFYNMMVERGHNVYVTVKDIPSAIILLEKYNIPYTYLGEKKDSLIGKGLLQIWYDLRIWFMVMCKHIQVGVGSSLTVPQVSRFSPMKSVVLDDDDDSVEPLFVKYGHRFADVVLSPTCTNRATDKCIHYDGYHELAYLHPNRFKPDPSILSEIGLNVGDVYFIVRFNAFKAHHDTKTKGLSIENKRKLIHYLSTKGTVYITTERNLDDEFLPYKLTISPEKVHSLMYYATMLIGDSQTMTSEAAVLGVPAIRCNTFVGQISYLEEEEHKYELTFGFRPENFDVLMQKIDRLLSMDDLRSVWQSHRQKMLSGKIDYSKFLTWFVENYPQSREVMQTNPDYQYNFR